MNTNDPMLDIYLYENDQLVADLETVLLDGEKHKRLSESQINEVFRAMHTIKGSSAMMDFDNLVKVTHTLEDLFSQIREKGVRDSDWERIFDIVLNALDFLKGEFDKIRVGKQPDGHSEELSENIHKYLNLISGRTVPIPAPEEDAPDAVSEPEEQPADEPEPVPHDPAPAALHVESADALHHPIYRIKLVFEPDCKMEHIRALGAVSALDKVCSKVEHVPADLTGEAAREEIVRNGFVLFAASGENPDDIRKLLGEVMFLQSSSMIQIEDDEQLPPSMRRTRPAAVAGPSAAAARPGADVPVEVAARQNFISVNVNKLDSLLNLVGEIVTAESMVTKNPDLEGLQLTSFETAAHHLRTLTSELQDIVMSVRMLPVSTMFHKMQRMVRDMSKKIAKNIELVIVGEETEVDKNIIDNLSDPLMHLIRNSVDHGIESPADRERAGKDPVGKITLEAHNTGGDVTILVADDGKGLDRNVLIRKATEKGLIDKPESEISDREAFNCIFLPGFSTKDEVTEYSGRGVGMDVVRKNIAKLGGTVTLDSELGNGTKTTIRIPLTLAIVGGMRVKISGISFIVPTLSIRQTFKPEEGEVFCDPDGNEMIMIRGECLSVFRVSRLFGLEEHVTNISDGLLMHLETDEVSYCVLIDELIGEQQAVVKPMPAYIQKHGADLHGIGGCTILGDGSISLIIDVNGLLDNRR